MKKGENEGVVRDVLFTLFTGNLEINLSDLVLPLTDSTSYSSAFAAFDTATATTTTTTTAAVAETATAPAATTIIATQTTATTTACSAYVESDCYPPAIIATPWCVANAAASINTTATSGGF